jgi:hypothetical protein
MPRGRGRLLHLGCRYETTQFDQVVTAPRASGKVFFGADASSRTERTLKIRTQRLRIEPSARRRGTTAPRQVLPDHRLEVFCRVVSFKSH